MTTVTFRKAVEEDGYLASTGERIAFYSSMEMYGIGSRGWYITEANGDFSGIKFDSLRRAKMFLIRRHNLEQYWDFKIASMPKKVSA